MLLNKVQTFLSEMAAKYPYLSTFEWDTVDYFLEDDKGYYVGVFPIKNSERGYVYLQDDAGPGKNILVKGRYYVVWRVPKLSDDIIRACIVETSTMLGKVVSATWNVELMYQLFTEGQTPQKDIPFVGIEVEVSEMASKNKDICKCLLDCYTGS